MRRTKRFKRYIRGGAAASLVTVIAACEMDLGEQVVLGTLERNRHELSAENSEPIRAVLVEEGQAVSVGQPLLRQDTDRVEAELARTLAQQASALAALAEAEQGPRAQEITQGRARLQAARSARETARHEFERQTSLAARNYISENQLDILRGKLEEADAKVEEAQAALDELLAGTRNEQIDQARSRYVAATADVKHLEISVRRSTIRSPVAGTVEALPREVGERPSMGSTVVVVLANTPTYARVHIPHAIRVRITKDTRAQIHVDGYDAPFNGRVRWVSSDAAYTPYYALSERDRSRLSYLSEIDLVGEGIDELPVGVPVEVSFPELRP